jgi:NADH:ubiquinone oxidoreductase subunit H
VIALVVAAAAKSAILLFILLTACAYMTLLERRLLALVQMRH